MDVSKSYMRTYRKYNDIGSSTWMNLSSGITVCPHIKCNLDLSKQCLLISKDVLQCDNQYQPDSD